MEYKDKFKREYTGEFKKPELGIMPRRIWLGHRAEDICSAMARNVEFVELNPILLKSWSDELSLILAEIIGGKCKSCKNVTQECICFKDDPTDFDLD